MSEINFVTADAQQIISELISDFEDYTGEVLYAGDARRIFLQGFGAVLVNLINNINTTGRSNLLRYAFGETLDAMGEFYGATRLPAQQAAAVVRFTLSEIQPNPVQIAAGTRVTPDGKLFFATDTILTIGVGDISGDVTVTALVAGAEYNGFTAGQINKIVDGNPYVAAAFNTTTSAGGSDTETDDDYRTRLLTVPYSYSTAGPYQAYYYWAKNASIDVGDISVMSPSAGQITIYVLKEGGIIPVVGDPVLALVAAAVNDINRRPLTDNVTVSPVTAVNTTIGVDYYINPENSASANAIQDAVMAAVNAYKTWQTSTIGRTINPDELRKRMLDAGASRVDVTTPVRETVTHNEVAQITSTTVTYKGLGD